MYLHQNGFILPELNLCRPRIQHGGTPLASDSPPSPGSHAAQAHSPSTKIEQACQQHLCSTWSPWECTETPLGKRMTWTKKLVRPNAHLHVRWPVAGSTAVAVGSTHTAHSIEHVCLDWPPNVTSWQVCYASKDERLARIALTFSWTPLFIIFTKLLQTWWYEEPWMRRMLPDLRVLANFSFSEHHVRAKKASEEWLCNIDFRHLTKAICHHLHQFTSYLQPWKALKQENTIWLATFSHI